MKELVQPSAIQQPRRAVLGQYWMVFVGSGLALALVTATLAFAVIAHKAESANKHSVSADASSEVAAPQSRPILVPARPLYGFQRVSIVPAATLPDASLSRPLLEIAGKDPVQFDVPDGMENPEIGQPEPKGIKDMLARLDHKYSQVRLKAIVGLGRTGAAARDAVPRIAKALGDPDKNIRDAAGKALARIGPAAVPVLIQELKSPASRNHILAARSLAIIGPEAADAVPALTECLKQKDSELLAMVAHALGEIGPLSSKAAASLTLLLGDASPEVQEQSRAALAKIGPGAIPALRGALKSPQSSIRRRAADLLALQGSKAKEATGDLIALLKDKQPAVRKSAALALAAIGPEASQASDALVECAQDTDASVRAAAALALGEIRARGQAISTLVNLFRDPVHDVRFQAIGAIIKIGPSALNGLINTIPHENIHMRTSAIFALGEIGPDAKDAVALLIDQLQDKLPLIRNQSALSLGKIGPRAAGNAVEPLKESIRKESDIPVRISMRLALVQLLPKDKEAARQLNQDVLASVIGTNQDLVNKTLLSVMRPKTPLEIVRQKKIQGVLDFYTLRNSFRFGDGLDKWSHQLLASLGPEAIPAMVDTLNRDNFVGGNSGFIVNGRQAPDGAFVMGNPPPGPMNVFFK